MTTSFYESLGRMSDAPPDISKTNYLRTEVDMSTAVNENIDKTQEQIDAHFDSLIRYYNQEHEKRMKGGSDLDKFIATVKQGKKVYDQVDEYLEYQKVFDDFFLKHQAVLFDYI